MAQLHLLLWERKNWKETSGVMLVFDQSPQCITPRRPQCAVLLCPTLIIDQNNASQGSPMCSTTSPKCFILVDIEIQLWFCNCGQVYFCCKAGHFHMGISGDELCWSQPKVDIWWTAVLALQHSYMSLYNIAISMYYKKWGNQIA